VCVCARARVIMIPGHAYVYKSFRGHNDCFNITSDSAGVPAAVLIRVVTLLPGLHTLFIFIFIHFTHLFIYLFIYLFIFIYI
jgi:hypothetical protein